MMDQVANRPSHCHTKADWWQAFYDDAAMLVLEDQSGPTVRRQVDQMIKVGAFQAGDAVLDQCCGLGQHAIELALRGYRVAGIDQSEMYIQAASDRGQRQRAQVAFQVADALDFTHAPPVDRVVNWHSSFGYLQSDQGNLRMLVAAFGSLRPGGTMLLEFPNMAHLIRHFQTTLRSILPGGGELTRFSQIDLSEGVLRQQWVYDLPGGQTRQHQSRLRLYLPGHLKDMMHLAGFDSVAVLSPEGETLALDDSRCLVLARRSGQ